MINEKGKESMTIEISEDTLLSMCNMLNAELEETRNNNMLLTKTILQIEKSILELRLAGLERGDSLRVSQSDSKCTCGCNSKHEEQQLEQPVEEVTEPINEKIFNAQVTTPLSLEDELKEAVSNIKVNTPLKSDNEVADTMLNTVVTKQRKPRKERGGSVFKEFETLSLNHNNDYEGNSILYSKNI